MSALPIGSKIHRYEIIQVLGSGGFGVVYLARHRSLGYQVVIKEFLPQSLACRTEQGVMPLNADVEPIFRNSLQKFTTECTTLLQLDHPNIVYVYDCFYDNGTAYMLMHYEIGNTLWQSYCDQFTRSNQPFSWPQLHSILPGVFSGLHYMHQRQLVHRDIKPSNIFLRAGTKLHPLIIDFGAVKSSGGFVSQYAQKTECYAAIEQESHLFPIGPWTDIHALGVLMLELLTTQRPLPAFKRQLTVAAAQQDPIKEQLDSICSWYGSQLADILQCATQLDPTKRFQDIPSFSNALGIKVNP